MWDDDDVGEKEENFKQFCQVSKSQERLLKTGHETRFLSYVMRQCPNIQSVALIDGTTASKHFERLPLLQSLSKQTGLPAESMLSSPRWRPMMAASALPSFLEAMVNSGKAFRHSTFEIDYPMFWCDSESYLTFTNMKTYLAPTLGNLTYLDMTLEVVPMGFFNSWENCPLSRVYKFISLATNLETFKMTSKTNFYHLNNPDRLKSLPLPILVTGIFRRLQLSKLKHIELRNAWLEVDDFVKFITLHAATIKQIGLFNLRLGDAISAVDESEDTEVKRDWEEAVEVSSELQCLSLLTAY